MESRCYCDCLYSDHEQMTGPNGDYSDCLAHGRHVLMTNRHPSNGDSCGICGRTLTAGICPNAEHETYQEPPTLSFQGV